MKILGTAVTVMLIAIFIIIGCQFTYQCGYDLGKSMKEPTPAQVIVIKEEVKPIIVEKTNDTIAYKNKNPLNVKCKGFTWKGQVDTDQFGHAVFSSWEYGVRAASYVLKNYSKKHKIDTVEGIVKRFAKGNNKEYINFLCKRLNLKKDEKFNVVNRMSELLRAMSRFESGQELPEELFIPYDVLTHI